MKTFILSLCQCHLSDPLHLLEIVVVDIRSSGQHRDKEADNSKEHDQDNQTDA